MHAYTFADLCTKIKYTYIYNLIRMYTYKHCVAIEFRSHCGSNPLAHFCDDMSSQSSDDIIGGPAPQGEVAESEDEIIGGPAALARRRRGRGGCQGRPRPPPTRGEFSTVLCLDTRGGITDEFANCVDGVSNCFCAGVCACTWDFVEQDDGSPSLLPDFDHRPRGDGAGGQPYAFVQYTIKDVWRLERFVPMDNILESGWINERAAFLEDLIDCVLESGSTCRDIPKEVFDNVGMVLPIMTVMSLSAILHSQWPAVLWLVGLTVRTHIASLLPKFPPTSTIQRWKKDRGVRTRAVAEAGASGSSRGLPAYDDIVLELPRAKRCRKADRSTGEPNKGKIADIDPVRMIKALTLSTLLRSQRDFKTALTAARGWEAADSDDDGAVPDDAVHASSLWRGFARCDITYMLLFRREWYADFLHDLIECITIFTDSSPNSGLEFQGMIATVRKTSGDFYSVTLPGSTLAYGLQDVLSKTIALVWSVWLLTGPDVASVEYFFQ